MSLHLRFLSAAGFVAEEQQGTRRIYSLRQEGAQAVQAYLETLWDDASARFRLMAENTSSSDDHTPENVTGEGAWEK